VVSFHLQSSTVAAQKLIFPVKLKHENLMLFMRLLSKKEEVMTEVKEGTGSPPYPSRTQLRHEEEERITTELYSLKITKSEKGLEIF